MQVDIFPLLSGGLGCDNSEHLLLEECLKDDGLFSDLVKQIVAKHPGVGQAILNPKSQQILELIVVFINNRQLRLPSGWDTKLENGDRVIFLMALPGG